jgi:addiction module HigA family antidote
MKKKEIKSVPFVPIHPGEIIKDEIRSRDISQHLLAAQMNVSPAFLNEVLSAKRAVTPEFALRIEAALNIDADIFVSMQARYNIHTARLDKQLTNEIDTIVAIAAI